MQWRGTTSTETNAWCLPVLGDHEKNNTNTIFSLSRCDRVCVCGDQKKWLWLLGILQSSITLMRPLHLMDVPAFSNRFDRASLLFKKSIANIWHITVMVVSHWIKSILKKLYKKKKSLLVYLLRTRGSYWSRGPNRVPGMKKLFFAKSYRLRHFWIIIYNCGLLFRWK